MTEPAPMSAGEMSPSERVAAGLVPGFEWIAYAPDDPRRVAKVLAYLENGASAGVGNVEWGTIMAVMRKSVNNSECTHPSGNHSLTLDSSGKNYCTWCNWPNKP